jgi:hypothetical protein
MTINIKDGEQWKSVKQFFVKEGGGTMTVGEGDDRTFSVSEFK